MITPPDQRIAHLLLAGVPKCFLDALDNLKQFGDLQYIVRPPDAAYHYLPQIYEERQCLAGFDVTPVFDGSNGDTYYVLLSKGLERRFVFFELEQDTIYSDFGSDFRLLLVDLLINLYEFSEEDLLSLAATGSELGLKNSRILFQSLQEADAIGARSTFESDRAWRAEHVPGIVA